MMVKLVWAIAIGLAVYATLRLLEVDNGAAACLALAVFLSGLIHPALMALAIILILWYLFW